MLADSVRPRLPLNHQLTANDVNIHFTAVYGRFIPAWNYYDCLTTGIFALADEHKLDLLTETWNCNARTVTQEVTPMPGVDVFWSDFGDILIALCEVIGDFKVPNVDYDVYSENQLIARGSIRYGNTGEE